MSEQVAVQRAELRVARDEIQIRCGANLAGAAEPRTAEIGLFLSVFSGSELCSGLFLLLEPIELRSSRLS